MYFKLSERKQRKGKSKLKIKYKGKRKIKVFLLKRIILKVVMMRGGGGRVRRWVGWGRDLF